MTLPVVISAGNYWGIETKMLQVLISFCYNDENQKEVSNLCCCPC